MEPWRRRSGQSWAHQRTKGKQWRAQNKGDISTRSFRLGPSSSLQESPQRAMSLNTWGKCSFSSTLGLVLLPVDLPQGRVIINNGSMVSTHREGFKAASSHQEWRGFWFLMLTLLLISNKRTWTPYLTPLCSSASGTYPDYEDYCNNIRKACHWQTLATHQKYPWRSCTTLRFLCSFYSAEDVSKFFFSETKMDPQNNILLLIYNVFSCSTELLQYLFLPNNLLISPLNFQCKITKLTCSANKQEALKWRWTPHWR